MNCPDCKEPTNMDLDFLDHTDARDVFEVVFKCPVCKATFFGTIYRDVTQTNSGADCIKCQKGENNAL